MLPLFVISGKEIAAIGGMVWGGIGLIIAILDYLSLLKFGLITTAANACAQSGNIECLPGTIETMLLFLIDVLIGPILLAANLMNGPLGIIGVIAGLVILVLAYGKSNGPL